MDDPFIRQYIGDLLRSLRTQYLIDLIKPYTRLELSFLGKVRIHLNLSCIVAHKLQQLNVEIAEVEEMLIGLILEGRVEGKIDQVGMRLELESKSAGDPFTSVVNKADNWTGKTWKRSVTLPCKSGQNHWKLFMVQWLGKRQAQEGYLILGLTLSLDLAAKKRDGNEISLSAFPCILLCIPSAQDDLCENIIFRDAILEKREISLRPTLVCITKRIHGVLTNYIGLCNGL